MRESAKTRRRKQKESTKEQQGSKLKEIQPEPELYAEKLEPKINTKRQKLKTHNKVQEVEVDEKKKKIKGKSKGKKSEEQKEAPVKVQEPKNKSKNKSTEKQKEKQKEDPVKAEESKSKSKDRNLEKQREKQREEAPVKAEGPKSKSKGRNLEKQREKQREEAPVKAEEPKSKSKGRNLEKQREKQREEAPVKAEEPKSKSKDRNLEKQREKQREEAHVKPEEPKSKSKGRNLEKQREKQREEAPVKPEEPKSKSKGRNLEEQKEKQNIEAHVKAEESQKKSKDKNPEKQKEKQTVEARKEKRKTETNVKKRESSKPYTKGKNPEKARFQSAVKVMKRLLKGVLFILSLVIHLALLLISKIDIKKVKPNPTMVTVCLVVLLGLVGTLWGRSIMSDFVERYDDGTILVGISIDGVDVSGMTRSQATEELRSRLMIYRENHIIFTIEERESFSGSFREIGLAFENLDEVVLQALEYGREGSLVRRARLQRSANRERLDVDLPLNYKISLEDLTVFLEPFMKERLDAPVNARIESGPHGVGVVLDQSGEIFDIEEAYEVILNNLNHHGDRARFTVDLTVLQVEAEVKASQLEGITDLLGTFTTSFADNNPSRAQNVENGASRINHLLMAPGEELSACELMRPYTEENGYAYGSMFMGNLIVEAIGGGICQVASTLYNALLYAEIEILQRNAHSMPVAYVSYSRDAAIAEGLLDFRWRNNMSTPIYIEAVIVPGQTITFNIFGEETRPANRRIEFVSEATYGEIPQGIQFVASEYGIGSMWIMSEARALISAYLTKVIFIDDVEVERIRVNFSYYQESPRIMSVGTGSYNPDNTALMLGAISSQDYDTIRNTINQILFGWQPVEETGGYTGGYSGGYEGYSSGYVGGY